MDKTYHDFWSPTAKFTNIGEHSFQLIEFCHVAPGFLICSQIIFYLWPIRS